MYLLLIAANNIKDLHSFDRALSPEVVPEVFHHLELQIDDHIKDSL